MKRAINLLLVLMFLFVGARRCLAQTISMQYENGFLSADIQSATIKEIFEELKRQAGLTYEIDKEIEGQKVTVEFKDLSLKAGIEKILDLTGLKDLAISYRDVSELASERVGQLGADTSLTRQSANPRTYKISRVEIRKRDSKIADGTSLEGLIQIGLKGERQKRREIVDKIKGMGKEGGLKLLEMAKEKGRDEKERVLAILLLGEVRCKDAAQGLTDVLKTDGNEYCREASVLALADIGDTAAVQSFKEALKDESGNVRQRAVLGLAKLGDKSHADVSLKGLRDGSPTEKLLATMALEEIGDTAVIKELKAEELKSKDVWTKINVNLAIKKIEYKNTKEENRLDYLKETLKDKQFEINSWAVEELIKVNSSEAMKIIEETAKDSRIAGSYAAGKWIRLNKEGSK